MGLNLEISLDKDINQINAFFSDLKFKAITKAARQALNRTVDSTRSIAIKELLSRRRLNKLKDLKGFVRSSRARGNNIAKLEASITFSANPLPLILFIVGTKVPRILRKPNSERKPRSFEIIKGQRKSKSGLFIQKAARGKRRFLVFRRGDPKDRSKGFRTQSAPSTAHTLRTRSDLLNKIESHALNTLQKTFSSALKNELGKLKL